MDISILAKLIYRIILLKRKNTPIITTISIEILHFKELNMNSKKDFQIYLQINQFDTSNFKEITNNSKIFLLEKEVLKISWMTKKQLDLYIFRHPEIIKTKNWNDRVISINILNHVLKNIKRIKNNIL